MRCTSCSQPVKPVVALDVDGTMGKYHDTFLHFLYQWAGLSVLELAALKKYAGACEFSDWIHQVCGITKEQYQQAKLAFRAGGFKRWMPAFDDLEQLVFTLRNEDAEVWVTTTRPWMRMDNIDPDTREWLRRNRVHYDHLLFDEDKYAVLKDRVDPARIVMILEDQHDQFDRAVELSLPVVLRQSSYNQDVLRTPACATLAQAAVIADQQIKRWRSNHAR